MADIRMRGAKLTPRHRLAAAMPHRITGATPPNFIVIPPKLDMWYNDIHGDCVTAEEAFAKACYNPEIFINPEEVKRWATHHGVLDGAYLEEVLKWMTEDGFHQDGNVYNDGAYQAIDWTNAASLTNAISQGPVKIGVAANQIAAAAGNTNGWFGTGWSQDQNIDHCVGLPGYGTISWLAQQLGVTVPSGVDGNAQGYALYTWKTIGIVDVPSLLAVTAEAWLRKPTTVIVGPNPPPPPVCPPGTHWDVATNACVPDGPPPPVCPPGQHWDATANACVPDGPIPPTPPSGTVTIPDQTLSVPGLFGSVHHVLWKGGVYPVNFTGGNGAPTGITIPPWLLIALKAACGFAPALPPPFNFLAMTICGLLPHNAEHMAAAGQSHVMALPPRAMLLLRLACQMAPSFNLPEPWKSIIVGLCGLVPPHAHSAPCGGCH